MTSLTSHPLRTRDRAEIAVAIILLCFTLIIVRLWYLQVFQHNYFLQLAENNQVRTVFIPPPRGLILARDSEPLVSNRPSFNIEFVSADCPNPRLVLTRVAKILEKDQLELLSYLKRQRKRYKFEPAVLLKDASRDQVGKILAQRYHLPGVSVQVVPSREYLSNGLAAHLLGYTREISAKQLDKPEYAEYRNGEIVGHSGIEVRKESSLHGKRGVQKVIVNASGVRIKALAPTPESQGKAIQLTLDMDVQKAADDALADKKGAIVVLDARTGEVLAMSSAPRFDPNVFTREVPTNVWSELMSPVEFRLTNRAIQGLYPPGSVFKMFMAAAILAEGIKKEERVNCPGSFTLGGRTFACHKKTGHGSVNLREALIQSCDVYFYTMGVRLRIEKIHEYATRFGLGQLTGIDLDEEKEGLVPSPEWKKRMAARLKERGSHQEIDGRWYAGETPSVVIGQGAVSLTPLQIARATAALVNGGKVLQPQIIKDNSSKKATSVAIVRGQVGIDKEILDYVRESLVAVVYDPRGTGHKAQLGPGFEEIKVGGKTGTAQPASVFVQGKGDEHNDHAWFSGFAPAEDPEIVVTALVENGGHGGAAAAPLVKQVMEAYFKQHSMEWVVANPVKVQAKKVEGPAPRD